MRARRRCFAAPPYPSPSEEGLGRCDGVPSRGVRFSGRALSESRCSGLKPPLSVSALRSPSFRWPIAGPGRCRPRVKRSPRLFPGASGRSSTRWSFGRSGFSAHLRCSSPRTVPPLGGIAASVPPGAPGLRSCLTRQSSGRQPSVLRCDILVGFNGESRPGNVACWRRSLPCR